MELDEAIRLYEINKDTEIVIHGMPNFHPDFMSGIIHMHPLMCTKVMMDTFKKLDKQESSLISDILDINPLRLPAFHPSHVT